MTRTARRTGHRARAMRGSVLVLLGCLVVALVVIAILDGSRGSRSAREVAVPEVVQTVERGQPGPTHPREVAGGGLPPKSNRAVNEAVRPLLPDGGLAALGLAPASSRPQHGDEVPAELRLADAREAVDRFAERVSALERERRDTTDPTQRAALDETLAVLRGRLRMAEIAERSVAAELASRP